MPRHLPPQITLDQWRMLQAVVDCGGYGKAAEHLQKSQSTISYALQKMQEELGVSILQIQGRKASLTDEGATLLRRARRLLEEADALNDVAAGLRQGVESQITINVDVIFPKEVLMRALQQFEQHHPLIRLDVIESSLSGTQDAIVHEQADLVLAGMIPPGFLSNEILTIRMHCVAHRDHPLSQLNEVTEQDLQAHRQIVVRDSGAYRRLDTGWLGAEKRWTVNDFTNSLECLLAGFGFAWIPDSYAADPVASGELVLLPVSFGANRSVPISLIFPRRERTGPAAELLGRLLTEQAKAY